MLDMSKLTERGFVSTEIPTQTIPLHDKAGNTVGVIKRDVEISNFDQHPETSLAIAQAIKKYGGHDLVPKEEWNKLNAENEARKAKKANPLNSEMVEARAEEAQRYALAACRLAAADFEGLSLDDLLEIMAVSKRRFRTLGEWRAIIRAARE